MCAPPHRGPALFRRWSLAEPERSRPGEPVMNRTTLVAITLLSALATPVVVNATSLAKADVAAATASVAAPRTEEPGLCAADQGRLCRLRRGQGDTLRGRRPRRAE